MKVGVSLNRQTIDHFQKQENMKKISFIFAAAILFMSASAFAQTTTPKKEVKKETATTQEKAPLMDFLYLVSMSHTR